VSNVAVSSVANNTTKQELERLFHDHYQLLYRTAYSMLNNHADAEDVPQTLFLRLLRSGLTPDLQQNARGYLYRATVNLALDIVRSKKRRSRTETADGIDIPAEPSNAEVAEEMHRRLTEALAELDQESAQMLMLRYVHNYSDANIAKMMGASRGTIAMRLLRARSRLKKLMRDCLERNR
jgi:RNA polymerase sigma-70 factor (ECF subfamily)